jgi:hypothetical protein
MAAVARALSRAFLPTYLLFLLPARWLGRLVQRIGAVVQAGSIGGQRTLRWCDSTERALNDDHMGLRRRSFTVG